MRPVGPPAAAVQPPRQATDLARPPPSHKTIAPSRALSPRADPVSPPAQLPVQHYAQEPERRSRSADQSAADPSAIALDSTRPGSPLGLGLVPIGITITSPPDGYTIPSGEPPVIVVEGQLEDRGISTVWLVANERPIPIRAEEGRFRQVLLVVEPVLRLWAETPASGGPPHQSQTVTVRADLASSPLALLVIDWPQESVGIPLEVSATWRAHPERLDGPVQTGPMDVFRASRNDALPQIFYRRRLKPGAYTLALRYQGPVSSAVLRPTLYLPTAGRLQVRTLTPVSLNGIGTVVLAKVLIPQGVLWEDDNWFNGQSESAETITKFRFPEGISWTEPKAGGQ